MTHINSKNRSSMDLFQGIQDKIDTRINARDEYETRVASKKLILDVGGRNHQSKSYMRLNQLSSNSETKIISTDIVEDYQPDVVDDICDSHLESDSYDAIYCDAILEHVKDYEAAVRNIHRLLKPGGEVFIYVPFSYCFHDLMDYHRFTFSEVDRILEAFSEHKIFLPDGNGYGGVFWLVLTFFQIERFPKLWNFLSIAINLLLTIPITFKFIQQKNSDRKSNVSFQDYRFYYTHLLLNHGFCGWAMK